MNNPDTVKGWEMLAMKLVETWLRAQEDSCLHQIALQHMTELDAAQATGVISAFPSGQEAKLHQAVAAQGPTNYDALTANLPLWISQFWKGLLCHSYQLSTFHCPGQTTKTPSLQQLQNCFCHSWDGSQLQPVLPDLLSNSLDALATH